MWSRKLVNEEAVAHWGLSRRINRSFILVAPIVFFCSWQALLQVRQTVLGDIDPSYISYLYAVTCTGKHSQCDILVLYSALLHVSTVYISHLQVDTGSRKVLSAGSAAQHELRETYIKQRSRVTIYIHVYVHVQTATCFGCTHVAIIRVNTEPWIRKLFSSLQFYYFALYSFRTRGSISSLMMATYCAAETCSRFCM